MGMKASEIILDTRRQVDDLSKPYLRSDELFLADLNEAVREACRRSRLIVDSSSPEVCTVAFAAGDTTSELDERVIFVRRVKWEGRDLPLRKVRREDIDRYRPGWETDTAEEPTHVVAGMESGAIRPYPTPTVSGAFLLTVVREPLQDVKLTDEPEVPPRARRALTSWLRWRYYSMQDSETRDEKKAAEALAEFEREFGPQSNTINEVWIDQQHGIDEDEGLF